MSSDSMMPDLGTASLDPTPTLMHRLWASIVLFAQVPSYHLILEAFLVSWVIWLLIRRVSFREKRLRAERLSKEEEEELISEWKPEPLVPEVDPNHPALHVPVIEEKPGKYMTVDSHKCLNLATHNYLGFAGNETIEKAAIECIKKFGVGSCGPRAFYGTADVHVHLEEALAAYFGTEQAVLYSYGFSTIASAIPAYAKKGDIIFVDECVNFAIQKGLDASRSKIKFFRHNDVQHLQQLLEQQAQEDKKHPNQAKVSRRFLVIEGIYFNTGKVVNIEPMIELKRKYKLRFFIDESVSFGTLGEHGRGITEYKNISLKDVDLIMGTLESAMGSIGGFCVGTTYVVEHQTLAGLGYCFSASLPPMLAAGALKGLELMSEKPKMFSDIKDRSEELHNAFEDVSPRLELFGDRVSCVKHLRVRQEVGRKEDRQREKSILNRIVVKSRARGVALVLASYLEPAEVNLPPASIRLTASTLLPVEDISMAAKAVKAVAEEAFEEEQEGARINYETEEESDE